MKSLSLRLQEVSHYFAGSSMLTPAPVSFALQPGERALVVGPNGAGKTTLLLRISGLLVGNGTTTIGETIINPRTAIEVRRHIGFLFQKPDDGILLSRVLDDVCLGPVADGVPDRQARELALERLDRLGIASIADASTSKLSQGQKQLVALGGILVREPGLLLLDEPTAPLDEASTERVLSLLDAHESTQVIVTHRPELFANRPRVACTIALERSPK